MKNIATIAGALIFSTLFYKQNIGVNLSLFSIVTILLLVISNTSAFKKRNVILATIAYFISGVAVFLYKSNLSIIANLFAFFTLIGSVSEYKSSIYVKWINGIYTAIVATFSLYYDSLTSEVKNIKKEKINYTYWFKIIGIPTVILIVFISLYRNGNPLFDELISKIDLSFINIQWILLAGLGYYLFYNITHPIQIEPATVSDINTGNCLIENNLKTVAKEKLKSEKQLGIVLIALLNILIILFLTTDIYTLLNSHQLRASEFSYFVHSGINALIASIILAIVIIIYFFRGNLNFYKENSALKNLTYLWIFLNAILVIITTIKDYEYIISFGFTYKRIGVLIYLFLALIGLTTTFIKVNKTKNIWYLFRENAQLAFVLLILSATINWDKMITYYNINYAKQIDIKYLINLSDNNTFLLKEYAESNTLNDNTEFDIDTKHADYTEDLHDNSWQEMVYDNLKIK